LTGEGVEGAGERELAALLERSLYSATFSWNVVLMGDTEAGILPRSSTDLDHALVEILCKSPGRRGDEGAEGGLGEGNAEQSRELGVRVEERSTTDLLRKEID
jgi:hypothetical protein